MGFINQLITGGYHPVCSYVCRSNRCGFLAICSWVFHDCSEVCQNGNESAPLHAIDLRSGSPTAAATWKWEGAVGKRGELTELTMENEDLTRRHGGFIGFSEVNSSDFFNWGDLFGWFWLYPPWGWCTLISLHPHVGHCMLYYRVYIPHSPTYNPTYIKLHVRYI